MHERQMVPPTSKRRREHPQKRKQRPPKKKSLSGQKNKQAAGQKKMAGVVEPQQSREKTAALYYAAGFTCEQAVFAAFAKEMGLSLVKAQQEAPQRKERGTGCGAYRAALAVLANIPLPYAPEDEGLAAVFEERFIAEFGSTECQAIKEGRRDCMDVIEQTARLADEIITQYEL